MSSDSLLLHVYARSILQEKNPEHTGICKEFDPQKRKEHELSKLQLPK